MEVQKQGALHKNMAKALIIKDDLPSNDRKICSRYVFLYC